MKSSFIIQRMRSLSQMAPTQLHRCLLFIICYLSFNPAGAQTGSWRAYMSYYEPQQIVKASSNLLFVRASNDLYSYNMSDQSITTYDKINALNDTYITNIAWNATAKRLVIVYQNSNIDLIDLNDKVTNISALYTKSMTQDKTVNSIYINEQFAYLATNFGVVKVNVQRAEIAESYILNEKINAIGISGDEIYIKNTNGLVLSGRLTDNLIDPHNWGTPGSVPSGVFNDDKSDWNENIELVKTLKPGGPKHNHFGFMRLKYGNLYTCGTGYETTVDRYIPGTVQILKNGEWQYLQDDFTGIEELQGNNFLDMMSVDVDPLDHEHIFAGGRTGLFEYQNNTLKKFHSINNSPLLGAFNSNNYMLIETLLFDENGTLWLLQSMLNNAFITYTKEGEWEQYQHQEMQPNGAVLAAMKHLMIDSRGLMWFVNDHYDYDSFYAYDPNTNQFVNAIATFNNQDGTTIADYRPHCIIEDQEGNIWIGTKVGPFMLDRDNIYTKDTYLTQIKVPRNDGSNYADYLLSGVNISCMAIDGGGRKWFGTNGAGVYLISSDNMTQLEYFTVENSPLLSNNIESIAIDNKTGEVFFGTDKGLCSYMSDATESAIEMVKDDVYAYPNPVVSGYDGLITIVGLSMNADVKILSASGQLVAQGRSNGGTFTWNGRDRTGKRVASGVYMVATATSDGKKGTVCKIAVIK